MRIKNLALFFHSLKYFGYLFPSSIKDVERFEELYGDTEIDIPEHIQSPETIIIEDASSIDFELSYDIAAFSADNTSHFEIPNDLDDEEDERDNSSIEKSDEPTDK